MAWEWAAPAAGAAVGLGGLTAAWFTARGSRRHEREMAEMRHRQDQDSEDRRWRRDKRTEVYLELLKIAAEYGAWLHSWYPVDAAEPDRKDLPDEGRVRTMWASLTAFGSEQVWDAAKAWDRVCEAAVFESGRLVLPDSTTWSRFDPLRDDEEERRLELADRVALELGDRRPGRPADRE